MLSDLQTLLDRATGKEAETLEGDLRSTVRTLWDRQFIYADDHGGATPYELARRHRTYLESLFEAMGFDLVIDERERLVGILDQDGAAPRTLKLDEALFLLALRVILRGEDRVVRPQGTRPVRHLAQRGLDADRGAGPTPTSAPHPLRRDRPPFPAPRSRTRAGRQRIGRDARDSARHPSRDERGELGVPAPLRPIRRGGRRNGRGPAHHSLRSHRRRGRPSGRGRTGRRAGRRRLRPVPRPRTLRGPRCRTARSRPRWMPARGTAPRTPDGPRTPSCATRGS
ncbi:DUF4194 domain-containing protein [Azospirillum sp. TSH100]|nr:DUF4194 domain-containing protein [Azospirillum sp. TSH100]